MISPSIIENLPSRVYPTNGNESPDVVVESLRVDRGTLRVVRDDRLAGGTKQRAILPYLRDLIAEGFDDYVYASPFCGYAQVALASACSLLGVRATIYCEGDQTAGRKGLFHPFSERARSLGAQIIRVENLEEATREAHLYAREKRGAIELPLGFDSESFREHLGREVTKQWAGILDAEKTNPRAIWLPLGSGTLASVFSRVVPKEIQLHCVNVRIFSLESPKLARFVGDPRIILHDAPELFSEPARLPPEIPSNIHYDAKLWQFLKQHAEDGDLWWNVGP